MQARTHTRAHTLMKHTHTHTHNETHTHTHTHTHAPVKEAIGSGDKETQADPACDALICRRELVLQRGNSGRVESARI